MEGLQVRGSFSLHCFAVIFEKERRKMPVISLLSRNGFPPSSWGLTLTKGNGSATKKTSVDSMFDLERRQGENRRKKIRLRKDVMSLMPLLHPQPSLITPICPCFSSNFLFKGMPGNVTSSQSSVFLSTWPKLGHGQNGSSQFC